MVDCVVGVVGLGVVVVVVVLGLVVGVSVTSKKIIMWWFF